MLLAAACRAAGDTDTARLELAAAKSAFVELGSADNLRRRDGLLADPHRPPDDLSPRELDVLRLVAGGRTNRQSAAELVIASTRWRAGRRARRPGWVVPAMRRRPAPRQT